MIPYQVTFKGFHSSETAWLAVQDRVERLGSIYDRISHCDVRLTRDHKHHRGGQVNKVQIHISMPVKGIMISHNSVDKHLHRSLLVTIRDAFDTAELALEKRVQLLRHNIKHHESKNLEVDIFENGA